MDVYYQEGISVLVRVRCSSLPGTTPVDLLKINRAPFTQEMFLCIRLEELGEAYPTSVVLRSSISVTVCKSV